MDTRKAVFKRVLYCLVEGRGGDEDDDRVVVLVVVLVLERIG